MNYARHTLYAGNPEEALIETDLAAKLAVQPWQRSAAWSVRATAFRQMGRTDEAINAASKAVELAEVTRSKIAYEMQRAGLLSELGRFPEVHAALVRVIALGGGNRTDTLAQLGDLALASDRPDLARKFYMDAYSMAPKQIRDRKLAKTNDPSKWYRLGNSFSDQRLVKDAAWAYEEAARLEKALAQPGKLVGNLN
jgi:tetratricopeptide (TPR) repeat protein